ncbi:(S)-2-haloacid dehalogenase [Paraburkholderia ultramafica]|uniref:(S)-2-haloacid dehalogenase n=1 Tax=Paraburkholderia ultramafica TaxID=1544867 RepID=A0A6S7BM27_9BURK|nr:haloacid dehalogenase type II [Paraburkholderia ultramafica]CAB3803563.1 (S)-2-haloacid dehalogenase [Paraburkholderia ultramafica]
MSAVATRGRTLVFDVNETLLDIEVLNPFFERVFGDARVMRQWFAELILYSEALTLSGEYTRFGTLAVAVLQMVATFRQIELKDGDLEEFKSTMSKLPPHREVPEALEKLANAGFRMMTLTNSAGEAGKASLVQARLYDFFEHTFSVDEVAKFKPAREVYVHVARALNAQPSDLRLIASHTWDTLGALAAGYSAALVARPGNAPLAVGAQPDIVEPDLLQTATRIIEVDR